MAGAMRKMAVYLGLVEDEEHYDEDFLDDDDSAGNRRSASAESAGGGQGATSLRRYDTARSGGSVAAGGVATTVRRVPTRPVPETAPESYRITTLHPRSYSDALPIGESFREGTTVIMDLTDVVHDEAKRLVDFAAGLTFGLRGSIERVTREVFLLSPADVEVTAEDKARIAKGGFFNQS